MHKSKTKWICVDCSRNTKYEHYFVHNDVWFGLAGMTESGMLCVACLEARIGRELRADDFTDCFLNDPRRNPMTNELRERIGK